jgi:hypothetical protein
MGTTTNTALPLHSNDAMKRRRTPFDAALMATRFMIQTDERRMSGLLPS